MHRPAQQDGYCNHPLVYIGSIGYIDCVPRTSPLLNFVVEPNLLRTLDDFRYSQRFPTRAAAIKWLLQWALKQRPQVRNES